MNDWQDRIEQQMRLSFALIDEWDKLTISQKAQVASDGQALVADMEHHQPTLPDWHMRAWFCLKIRHSDGHPRAVRIGNRNTARDLIAQLEERTDAPTPPEAA